jgi:hypothetical protein
LCFDHLRERMQEHIRRGQDDRDHSRSETPEGGAGVPETP